ncbi:MAG: hypothetical protein D6722_04090, partial [Bacteroidetes bacterium]
MAQPSTDFPALWQQVDSLASARRSRDAAELSARIETLARAEGNPVEALRGLLHTLRFRTEYTEKADSLNIATLQARLQAAEGIERPILHSLLGETYMQYYNYHRWEIADRAAQEVTAADFATWDATTFLRESGAHYLAALSPAELLQQSPVGAYARLLNPQEGSARYRPTLYDLLAHRALDHFSNSANTLPESEPRFVIPLEAGMQPAEAFVQVELATPDTNKALFRVMTLLQTLTRWHLTTGNRYALVDLDLKRLSLVRTEAEGENKSSAYLAALQALETGYAGHPAQADVTYTIAQWYAEQARSYDPFAADPVGRDSYLTVRDLCRKTTEAYPGSRGATNCAALLSRIQEKSLSLQAEAFVAPRQVFPVSVAFRNLDRLFFRAVRLTPALQEALSGLRYHQQDERLKLLMAAPAARSWTQPLPEARDFHPHRTEIAALGLPAGNYILLASDSRNFELKGHAIALLDVQVTGMAVTGFSTQDGQRVYYLTDRQTGAPLAGVRAEVKGRPRPAPRVGTSPAPVDTLMATDDQGRLQLGPRYTREYLNIKFVQEDDVLETNAYYLRPDSEPSARERTVFFTDRRIYRPGQTIYFKALALQQEGDETRLLPRHRLAVTFYDANRQEVKTLQLQTNEFGSASGEFVAPLTGLTGTMTLSTGYGDHDVNVEEYKRPTFEVTFKPVSGAYALEEEVTVTGQAAAFTGAALDGATVSYRVVREAQFPYWYFWGRRPGRSETAELARGEVTTTADGAFSIPFTLAPDAGLDPADKPVFTYTIYADVTDITGETRSGQASLRAGYVALELGLDLPDQLFQDRLAPVGLQAHNLSGEAQATEATLRVFPLKAPAQAFRPRLWERPDMQLYTEREYRQRFPRDLYAQEDTRHSWPAGAAIVDQAVAWSGEESLTLTALRDAAPGAYKAVLRVDSLDLEVVRYFTLSAAPTAAPAVPTWLDLHLSQSQAEPGDTVVVHLHTSEKKLWVQYQLSFKGQTLDEQLLVLTPEGHSLTVPIDEAYRGGLMVQCTAVAYGRAFSQAAGITVPWTNKELQLSWETFRSDLLPGQQEEWRLRIRGPQAEAVSAEMVATLYDASLDAFRANQFALSLYPQYRRPLSTVEAGFGSHRSQLYAQNWNTYQAGQRQGYDQFDWCGFSIDAPWRHLVRGSGDAQRMVTAELAMDGPPSPAPAGEPVAAEEKYLADSTLGDEGAADFEFGDQGEATAESEPAAPQIRSNLNETAFFFPHLQTNAEGEVILAFKMPEALTRWKFLGLAHTRDLAIGTLGGETVTQKDLMVVPNLPRFVREGDRIRLTAKVVNLSEKELSGTATLGLLDALSLAPADAAFQMQASLKPFTVAAGGSTVLGWEIVVPEGGPQALMTRFVAQAGDFSDGQENVLPVLTNRMLVTETQPLLLRAGDRRETVRFENLLNAGDSKTLRHERLTLEMTTNPAWYAVQALPYLMEFPHSCTEQIFSRYYANALATHIAQATPQLQAVFAEWQQLPADVGLVSNLEKNADLKQALLTETPWVLQAQSESERKRQIGILFDMGRMAQELQQAQQQLAQRQGATGAFSWFPGMPESRYITQLIATGMGQLTHLGISLSGDQERASLAQAAVAYLDAQVREDYQRLIDLKANMDENHLSPTHIQYLYMRSYYDASSLQDADRPAYDYFYGQARQYWNKQSLYMMGMLALVFQRNGDAALASELIEALRQNAVMNPHIGMYWKSPGGYFWYQAPIERQALFIEAFDEVAGDAEAVDEMRVWLLQNKRTNDWGTTRATAAACYALLQRGEDWLGEAPPVYISLGDIKVDPSARPDAEVETGTGHYQTSWSGDEIVPEMGKIKLKRDGRGLAWGALYWQYFEQMDKIGYAETPLSIRKELFVEERSPNGPVLRPLEAEGSLQPGDKLVVRIELRVDRAMEYVHLKDLRAAGLEPINVLSGYRYQGGLGYYESTRDAATH